MTVDEQLAHLKEVAQNARTTWFGLLAVLLFVGVTLMGHQDRDFFAFGAATTLPLVNIDVPPTSFFIAAPILTAALYCYLHVYLLSLWEALGRIPQEEGAEPLADRVYPMLFTIAGLWFRNARRGDGSMAPRVLGRWTIATALVLGWGAGPFLVIALAWTAHAAHDPITALLGALAVWASLAVGLVSLRAAWLYLSDEKGGLAPGGGPGQFTLSAAILIGAVLFSLARTQGGDPLTNLLLDHADLAEAEITAKPAVWLDHEDWVTEYTATFRKREGLGRDQAAWTLEDREVLKTELKKRWAHLTGSLNKISLAGSDLRGANLNGAFLVAADFRCEEQPARKNQWEGAACARLDGATLINARMEGANLSVARLEGANLRSARMEGANLREARLEGAKLRHARLEGADLLRARMEGADLLSARMEGADLRSARMERTDLYRTRLEGADLSFAWMQGANLSSARMEGANLRQARLEGAELLSARMEGADLRSARMKNTVCTRAAFTAAVVHSAEIGCRPHTLQQRQLSFTVGNLRTLLPAHVHVWSCLDRGSDRVAGMLPAMEEALSRHPDERDIPGRITRWQFERLLFCEEDEIPKARGTTHFEKRFQRDFAGIHGIYWPKWPRLDRRRR